jgi:hypothetical protein
MKPYISYALALLLAVALIPAKTFSQQVNDNPADAALQQKAYKSLESLAEQFGSLKSAENRARIGSNIAGSLWPHSPFYLCREVRGLSFALSQRSLLRVVLPVRDKPGRSYFV